MIFDIIILRLFQVAHTNGYIFAVHFLTCTDSKTLLDERLSYIVKDRTDLRYKLISAVAFDQMTIQKYSAKRSIFLYCM